MSESRLESTRAWLPIVVQIIAILVAGLWVVANIQTTTTLLGDRIATLSNAVNELTTTVKRQDDQIQLNRADIAEMRGRLNNKQ